MRAVLALGPSLRRAGDRRHAAAPASDDDTRSGWAARLPRRVGVTTTALSVLAFAVTSALGLSVVGGLLGFVRRAADPESAVVEANAPTYVILAWTAVVLLVVPLLALGGAAARLGVARRDARLATLRLLGVTSSEVVALTVVETAWQGLLGAAAGIAGYGLLMPVWTSIPFLGRTFTAGELWVGPWGLLGALAVVPLLAAVSATVSLRRVVVSPLGVARRTTPPGMRWVRALAVVVAVVVFTVITRASGHFALGVAIVLMLGGIALVFGTLNLVGPWLLGVVGRVMVWRARTPAALLAGRRLLDDPRASWRVVGGLGLASFVAGVLSLLPAIAATDMEGDPGGQMLVDDLLTGGLLTLAIAFAVAASSAGILQAAGVLDRRREYALQQLAGVPVELYDAVRRREVIVPMVVVAGTSAGVALAVLLPIVGLAGATDPRGLLALLACLLLGGLAVVGATETSRPLLRSVLRETVVRAD